MGRKSDLQDILDYAEFRKNKPAGFAPDHGLKSFIKYVRPTKVPKSKITIK